MKQLEQFPHFLLLIYLIFFPIEANSQTRLLCEVNAFGKYNNDDWRSFQKNTFFIEIDEEQKIFSVLDQSIMKESIFNVINNNTNFVYGVSLSPFNGFIQSLMLKKTNNFLTKMSASDEFGITINTGYCTER